MKLTSIYPPHAVEVRETPTTEELCRIASKAVSDAMNESLKYGKHESGSWNQGEEANPMWHLTRSARHTLNAIMEYENLCPKANENTYIHIRNAIARLTLALAQTGDAQP